MDTKSKLLYGIIISLAFILLGFAIWKSAQKNDNVGLELVEQKNLLGNIHFDKLTKEWKDEYGVCHTCTPENGFSLDGYILQEPQERARLCYAEKMKSDFDFSDYQEEQLYNYYFLELIREGQNVRGNVESYPYGTDSSIAEFSGEYDVKKFTALVLGDFSAEGQSWQEEQELRFIESGVQSLYSESSEDESGVYRINQEMEKKVAFTFPKVSCTLFDRWQKESMYDDVLENISLVDTFSGEIIFIENGKDGYVVDVKNSEGEIARVVLSIPNLGPHSDFDFSAVKVGSIISVRGESFILNGDVRITAKHVNLESFEKEDYLGKTLKEAQELAKKNNVMFRVVKEDGLSLPVTKDYRPGRINASIEKGFVRSYFIEGKADKKTIPVIEDFIGMNEKEAFALAKKHDIPFRIVERDDVSLPVTLDFRVGRMNAFIKKGKVISVNIEANAGLVLKKPQDFQECLNMSGVIMESYPRQCSFDKEIFIENVKVESQEKILQIASKRMSCTGIVPQECYVVNDELFYDPIEGFDFESGYEYTLRVEERPRCDVHKPENCPLDVGLYSYHLLEILEKTKK